MVELWTGDSVVGTANPGCHAVGQVVHTHLILLSASVICKHWRSWGGNSGGCTVVWSTIHNAAPCGPLPAQDHGNRDEHVGII